MEPLKDICKDRFIPSLIPPPSRPMPSKFLFARPIDEIGKQQPASMVPDWRLLMMHLYREGALEKAAAVNLVKEATKILQEEPNLIRIPSGSDVVFVGDIHGQFYDLHALLTKEARVGDLHYVFLGDYVDRGQFSTEVVFLLFSIKLNFPDKITLLRGNHESRHMSTHFNFK